MEKARAELVGEMEKGVQNIMKNAAKGKDVLLNRYLEK
jgi:hypothetical protein